MGVVSWVVDGNGQNKWRSTNRRFKDLEVLERFWHVFIAELVGSLGPRNTRLLLVLRPLLPSKLEVVLEVLPIGRSEERASREQEKGKG